MECRGSVWDLLWLCNNSGLFRHLSPPPCLAGHFLTHLGFLPSYKEYTHLPTKYYSLILSYLPQTGKQWYIHKNLLIRALQYYTIVCYYCLRKGLNPFCISLLMVVLNHSKFYIYFPFRGFIYITQEALDTIMPMQPLLTHHSQQFTEELKELKRVKKHLRALLEEDEG